MTKWWKRAVLGTLFALALFWSCRALYIYQVWQIAYIWYPMVPHPSFGGSLAACLSPQTGATSSHGAFADIAFLRLPLSVEDAGDETSRQSFGALGKYGELVSVPMQYDASAEYCGGSPLRNDPRQLPAAVWGNCYNVANLFDTTSVKEGSAIWQTGDKGGLIVFDKQRNLLYVAAYQTH